MSTFALTFVLTDGFAPVQWTPLAKDGADLPNRPGKPAAVELNSCPPRDCRFHLGAPRYAGQAAAPADTACLAAVARSAPDPLH